MNNVKTLVAAIAMAFAGAALAAGGTAADGSYATSVDPAAPAATTNGGPTNTSWGPGSSSTGAYSNATGFGANSGTHSNVYGNSQGTGMQDVVIGDGNVTSANFVTLVGQQLIGTEQDIINIGNMGQIYAEGGIGFGASIYIAPNADFSTVNGAGGSSYALRGVANGFSASVLAGATDSAAIGSFSVADQARTVSVGNPTLLRRVTYVDTPVNATDAANKAYVDNAVASVSTAGIDELKGRVNGLENRINEVDRKVSGGVAIAMAVAAPVSLVPGESAMSVGSGYFGGQGAIAVSYAHSVKLDGTRQREKNELGEVIEDIPESELTKPWIFKEAIFSAGLGSSTAGDVGVRASMTFKW